jgi:membrane protein YdbS with pleckstrin-like domain
VGFPRKLLNEDEELVLDLRPHWWYLAGPIATIVVAAAVAVLVSVNDLSQYLLLAIAVVAVLAVAWLVARYLRWTTTNFAVTSDRLIYRSGVLAKQGIEIPLERVNTVFFSQSIFERLLRAGDLVIESAGERGQQSFSDIPRPSQVQNTIYRQIEDNNNRMYGGGRRGEPSVAEQIEKLDELRQKGILSAAEFQAKKAQLLDRL